jgi:hypothetical protein
MVLSQPPMSTTARGARTISLNIHGYEVCVAAWRSENERPQRHTVGNTKGSAPQAARSRRRLSGRPAVAWQGLKSDAVEECRRSGDQGLSVKPAPLENHGAEHRISPPYWARRDRNPFFISEPCRTACRRGM